MSRFYRRHEKRQDCMEICEADQELLDQEQVERQLGMAVCAVEEIESKSPKITLGTRICKLLAATEKPLSVQKSLRA